MKRDVNENGIRPCHLLTLKGRMRGLTFLSFVVLFMASALSYWEIDSFNSFYDRVQSSSSVLQEQQETDFRINRLLASIHSNLRLYMQSADDEILPLIRADIDRLSLMVPASMSETIKSLKEIVNVLEIRMHSLKDNELDILLTEKGIYDELEKARTALPDRVFADVYDICINVLIEQKRIHLMTLTSYKHENIKFAVKELSEVFSDAVMKLEQMLLNMPGRENGIIQSLIDRFYTLDEAEATVSAIRLKTSETESSILHTIDRLKESVARVSLESSEKYLEFIEKEILHLRDSFLVIVATFICMALLFLVVSYLVNRQVIGPIVEFVSLIKGLGGAMTRLRQECAVDSYFQRLSDFISVRHDEIGEVAAAIRKMLFRMQSLAFFRYTIEADETTDEMYMRLSKVLKDRLGFDRFVIYERPVGRFSMDAVYCSPEELLSELPDFSRADLCRAKRTGATVSSYEAGDICTAFPFHDVMDHYCIPMIVEGHVIGVVQLLLSKELSIHEQHKVMSRIDEARKYIDEMLPVLRSKYLAQELREMATRDQLTGLFNRHYLESALDQIVASIKRRKATLGIMMCDIDYFKQVNDKYGHDAGDDVLRQLAQILRNSVRSSDLVVRFGGEEFIILLLDCDSDKLRDIGEQIRDSVERYKFNAAGHFIHKTISIGISELSEENECGVWEAIKYADVALYKAKEMGRNRVVVFDYSMWTESTY